jgi:purine-cytosine permease-like protein
MSLLQILLLWFSANLTINNLAVALTGPLLFGLGFVDNALCAIFGVTLGALSTAYMATWGAVSGNRTMVCYHVLLRSIVNQADCLLRS